MTEADIEAFARDGVVCLRNAVSPEWVARLQEATADAMATPPPNAVNYANKSGEAKFYSEAGVFRRHPVFEEFTLRGPLSKVAAAMFRTNNVNLYIDHLFVKEAGAAAPTPWHHDLPYWHLNGTQIGSFWIALDAMDRDNGMVEYVRGSHRNNELYRPIEFGGDLRYDGMTFDMIPDIDAHRENFDLVSYIMQPGDLIAFHARTIHGAPANQSTRSRRALSIRYCGDDVRFHEWPGMPPLRAAPTLNVGDKLKAPEYPQVWPLLNTQ